jgi:hypothetical protein
MGSLIQILRIVAWPLVVLTIAFTFKRELQTAVNRITRLKYGELEFSLGLEQAEAKSLLIEQTIEASAAAPIEIDPELERLRRIAAVSPRAAIMEAWNMVEEAAAKSGFIQGANTQRVNAPSFVEWLVRSGKLPQDAGELISELRRLRNLAAHGTLAGPFELTEKEADRYLELAAKASKMILGPNE